MKRVRVVGFLVLATVACGPAEEDVTIRGTVTYAEYSSGDIVLKLVEGASEDCNLWSCTGHTPGDTVASQRLSAPGAFSMSASAQRDTDLALLAHAMGQAQNPWECEAGVAESMDVGDHSNVALVLVAGRCPALE